MQSHAHGEIICRHAEIVGIKVRQPAGDNKHETEDSDVRKVVSLLILLGCIILVVGATDNAVAGERAYSFFFAGNLGFAVSPDPFNSYYFMGFGAGGGVEYPVSSKWSFIGMIDYMNFSPDKGTIEGWWTDPGEYPNFINIDPKKGGVTATSFSIVSKGALKSEGSRIYPYVKGGFGLTIGSVSEILMYFDNLNTGRRDSMWVSVEGTETNCSIVKPLRHYFACSSIVLSTS